MRVKQAAAPELICQEAGRAPAEKMKPNAASQENIKGERR
jgi:hypothetical protein